MVTASSSSLGYSRIAITNANTPGGASTQGPLLHSRRVAGGCRQLSARPSAVQDSGTQIPNFAIGDFYDETQLVIINQV